MFKPENIFFVQGHGMVRQERQLVNTALGPIELEYDRFDVPENIFTASSMELGLNAAPDTSSEGLRNLLNSKSNFKIPNIKEDYKKYTDTFKEMGLQLFDLCVRKSTFMVGAWEMTKLQFQEKHPDKQIQEIFHVHGHKHPAFQSLPPIKQGNEMFFFSAPNDNITLGTVITQSMKLEPFNKDDCSISYYNGYFCSGIMPLDELSRTTYFNGAVILPTIFFSLPMNKWNHVLNTILSPEDKKKWKDAIERAITRGLPSSSNSDRMILSGEDNRDIQKMLKLDTDSFCNAFLKLSLKNVMGWYFWSTQYDSEEAFFKNTLKGLQYTTTSKSIIESVKKRRETQGKPDEPLLFIFYHCRPVGSGDSYGEGFAKNKLTYSRYLSLSPYENLNTFPVPPSPADKLYNNTLREMKGLEEQLKTVKNMHGPTEMIRKFTKKLTSPDLSETNRKKIQENIQKQTNIRTRRQEQQPKVEKDFEDKKTRLVESFLALSPSRQQLLLKNNDTKYKNLFRNALSKKGTNNTTAAGSGAPVGGQRKRTHKQRKHLRRKQTRKV